MGTAIYAAIAIGIFGIFFIYLIYVVLSVVFSLVKNIGKDKFIWYGQPLDRSYAKLEPYDSFADMLKGGIVMSLRLAGIAFVLILIVCICIEVKGFAVVK